MEENSLCLLVRFYTKKSSETASFDFTTPASMVVVHIELDQRVDHIDVRRMFMKLNARGDVRNCRVAVNASKLCYCAQFWVEWLGKF